MQDRVDLLSGHGGLHIVRQALHGLRAVLDARLIHGLVGGVLGGRERIQVRGLGRRIRPRLGVGSNPQIGRHTTGDAAHVARQLLLLIVRAKSLRPPARQFGGGGRNQDVRGALEHASGSQGVGRHLASGIGDLAGLGLWLIGPDIGQGVSRSGDLVPAKRLSPLGCGSGDPLNRPHDIRNRKASAHSATHSHVGVAT